MTEVVLGIDIGTSGIRICATAADNSLRAMSTATVAPPELIDGNLRQDPELWWQALVQAFGGLDLGTDRVVALAVDGTSGTLLPVTPDGKPVAWASMYNDTAAGVHVQHIDRIAPKTSAAKGATSPLARALSMPAGSRLLHQADWIAGRLAGDFTFSDENNSLKTGYDPLSQKWPEWIGETGVSVDRLPRVVPAGTRIGVLLDAWTDAFSLPRGVSVVAGTTDGCAAFLASGAIANGDGVTSLGTTLTIKLLSHTPVFAPEFGIYSHKIGSQWLAGGASNTGGAALKAHFSDDEISALSDKVRPDEPTGLDYYPLPKAGERFPVNDPGLKPKLTPMPESRLKYFQGFLEGIANIEAKSYQKLAELGASRLVSIRSLGGGSSNKAWTSLRLNRLGVPERQPLSTHAAVGTARLAWRGIGHAN